MECPEMRSVMERDEEEVIKMLEKLKDEYDKANWMEFPSAPRKIDAIDECLRIIHE